jgi:hypothetical protein
VTPATAASGGKHLANGVLDGIRVLDFGHYIA